MFDAGGAEKKKPERLEKPEKPDEEAYKASLKKAEKDHADAMAKFVCSPCLHAMDPSSSESNARDSLLTFYRMPSAPNWILPNLRTRTRPPPSAVLSSWLN
jgi:hypothetical protein